MKTELKGVGETIPICTESSTGVNSPLGYILIMKYMCIFSLQEGSLNGTKEDDTGV